MMHGLSLADCRRRRERGVTGRARVLSRRKEASGSAARAAMTPLVDKRSLFLSLPLPLSHFSLFSLFSLLFLWSDAAGPNQITEIKQAPWVHV